MAKKKKASKGKKRNTRTKSKRNIRTAKKARTSTARKTVTSAAKKGKKQAKKQRVGDGNNPLTPNICSDFTGGNGYQVQFQGIPAGGCTLGQDGSNNVFPFSPNMTGGNGLKYTNLQPGDITTIAVPVLNKTYPYVVSCCSADQGTHTVTVP